MHFTINYLKESLVCLQKAAEILGLSTKFLSKDKLILEIKTPQQNLRFWLNQNPFNNVVAAKIGRDKVYQAELLSSSSILIPKTFSFFNPHYQGDFQVNNNKKNLQQISSEITSKLEAFPIIIKENDSSLAKGVYLIQNEVDLQEILSQLFKKTDLSIFLAQEYLQGREFRVIAFRGKVFLAYEKISIQNQKQRFEQSDLNPLHSGLAQKVDHQAFQSLAQEVYTSLQIDFVGLDIIQIENNNLYVIEANANPACFLYNKSNGREDFIQLYRQVLQAF